MRGKVKSQALTPFV